ncbi:MAG: site-specific integrase [Bacteroidetes bacterium]|nr:site-specific integrase [Bacteroidota bacterium]
MNKKADLRLERGNHKGQAIWLLKFAYDKAIIDKLRAAVPLRWSKTKGSWYGPGTEEFLMRVREVYPDISLGEMQPPVENDTTFVQPAENPVLSANGYNTEIQEQVEKFIHLMETERLAGSTVQTYSEALRIFLQHIHPKPIDTICNDDVNQFLHQYAFQRKLSISWHRTIISALKLYFRRFEGKKLDPERIRYPKKDKLLPHVLDQKDIEKMIKLTKNRKHRSMLSLIYACGLRRGDLLNLKPRDIDSKRQQLFIRGGKGRKDRVVGIPQKMIESLREYYLQYRPKVWLFEGQKPGEQYSERSIQLVLKQALERAGLRSDASLHWLRHSFATHTLENGIDITYIKELLGHSSIRTTEIYTHVSREKMRQIRSPFEDLDL